MEGGIDDLNEVLVKEITSGLKDVKALSLATAKDFENDFMYNHLQDKFPHLQDAIWGLPEDQRTALMEEVRQNFLLEEKRKPIEGLAEELGTFIAYSSDGDLKNALIDRNYEALVAALKKMGTIVGGRESSVEEQAVALNRRVRDILKGLPAILKDWLAAEQEVQKRLRPSYISEGDMRHAEHAQEKRKSAGKFLTELDELITTDREKALLFEEVYRVFYATEYAEY